MGHAPRGRFHRQPRRDLRTYFHSSRGWWAQGDYTDDPDAVVTRGRSTPVQAHTVFFWRRDPNTPPLLFWATRFGGQVPVPYWATCLALAALPAARAAARWLRRPDRTPGPGFVDAPARDRSPFDRSRRDELPHA